MSNAIVNVNVGVHRNGIKSNNAGIGWKNQLVDFLFQGERILEIERLAGDNRLQSLVEPFPEGMDEASAVRADRASTERTLVDFYGEIKISEGIFKILLDPVRYEVGGVLRKAIAEFMFSCPLVYLSEKIMCRSWGLNFSLLDISVGVQEMFVKGPPNVVLRVNADRTEVLVGMSNDDIFIAANFLEDSGLGIWSN